MSKVFIGGKEYFHGIEKIPYEGKGSDNPLAFKFYDENKIVAGKSMKEHLRYAVAYWHTLTEDGSDPFGEETQDRPWNRSDDQLRKAEERADAAFEFFTKLGAPYYCFHDVDVAPDANDTDDVTEYEKTIETVTGMLLERQKASGIKLLWNTANMFSHPRYMNGAATNPDFRVLTWAAVQVKAMLDANVKLGGENYVFWGGREGYTQLFNTDMKREQEHLARFLSMARDYGRKIGFKGPFLIEPKPMEPSKHQYDSDAAAVIAFLKTYDLAGDFMINIEANHATLAGKAFPHDLAVAANAGLLGSIDANRGDPQNGWDTDQFPTDVYDATHAMLVVLQNGGLGSGGLNFDAKVRRNSTDLEDLFHAHIGGMDTFAIALEAADKILSRGLVKKFRDSRYESYNSGKGAEFEQGKLRFEDLRDYAAGVKEIPRISGKQEQIENVINQILFG
ncbi:xylose isomerase [Marispirochaeta sp.]|uniref:xylose isomerase n=1 Tax=Marispirochaeta sp. TaxID=2038653 RepID=UPI0029C88A76|nr:xylose isomerase [Marispirochaeta sp.]